MQNLYSRAKLSLDIFTIQVLAHHTSYIPLTHSDHAGGGSVGQEAAPLAVHRLYHREPVTCIGEMGSSFFSALLPELLLLLFSSSWSSLYLLSWHQWFRTTTHTTIHTTHVKLSFLAKISMKSIRSPEVVKEPSECSWKVTKGTHSPAATRRWVPLKDIFLILYFWMLRILEPRKGWNKMRALYWAINQKKKNLK